MENKFIPFATLQLLMTSGGIPIRDISHQGGRGQSISDFSDKRGGGVAIFLIFSDKGGLGVQHILTYLTKSKNHTKMLRFLLIFLEYDNI